MWAFALAVYEKIIYFWFNKSSFSQTSPFTKCSCILEKKKEEKKEEKCGKLSTLTSVSRNWKVPR